MAASYPYIVVAVILVYSNGINAKWLTKDVPTIKNDLLQERSRAADGVCDSLSQKEKQVLCTGFIIEWVKNDSGNDVTGFSSYNLPAPQLVDRNNPYACKTIPIEDPDMDKRMHWCQSLRYKVLGSNAIGEFPGFFLSGSTTRGRFYAYRTAQLSSPKVRPEAQLNDVPLAALRTTLDIFTGSGSRSSR